MTSKYSYTIFLTFIYKMYNNNSSDSEQKIKDNITFCNSNGYLDDII